VIRRYERATPGELVHVDIKKLGRIPDGGGHKKLGRTLGNHNNIHHNKQKRIGYAYLHNAVDDHSRLAYTEILGDERKETAAAFWQRANNYFTSCGITVTRALTDNGACYRSTLFAAALARRSPTSAPGPTAHRPTAKSNASTGPCSTNGPTPGPTAAKPNASPPSPRGYTPTITTAATPHSAAPHQLAASPTCQDRTARYRLSIPERHSRLALTARTGASPAALPRTRAPRSRGDLPRVNPSRS